MGAKSGKQNVVSFLLQNNIYIIALLFVVVPIIVFPGFGNPESITALMKNLSIWGLMALGLMFVQVLGHIDLSIGMNISMLTVMLALISNSVSLWVAIPIILIVGTLAGMLNGIMITKLKINSFITTLATQLVFKGIGLMLCNSTPVHLQNVLLQNLFEVKIMSLGFMELTLPMLLLFIVLALVIFVFKYTKFGRNLYIVGGNIEAANMAGIDSSKITVKSFMITGLICGLTAILVTSFQSSGNGAGGERYALQSIAACVLGGVTLEGGRGKATGVICGVLVIQLISKVIYQLNALLANLQTGIIGLILVVVLIVDKVSMQSFKNKEEAKELGPVKLGNEKGI